MRWIAGQIGQREHYAVARALDAQGELARLVTDYWSGTGSVAGLLARLVPRLAQRCHEALAAERVVSFNAGLLALETGHRLRRIDGWPATMERNGWFCRQSESWLKRNVETLFPRSSEGCVFAYSYAASGFFRAARSGGLRTVLGQIDPGPAEFRWVKQRTERYRSLEPAESSPPEALWENWRSELEMADRIVVNSEWSRRLLVEEGVDASNICVIPLAYEATPVEVNRQLPVGFSRQRPLRVLFLGRFYLRKGAGEILEAAGRLAGEPVRWDIVGPVGVKLTDDWIPGDADIRFHGPCGYREVDRFYREADLLLLPTHSDGFAITQLEALARGCPVVASPYCADVVRDGLNGLRLAEVSPDAIVDTLRRVLDEPDLLGGLWSRARLEDRYSTDELGRAFGVLAAGLAAKI